MSIYLRENSYYYDFWFLGARYRKSVGPVSRADAEWAELQRREQLATEQLHGPLQPPYTWGMMCSDFLRCSDSNCRRNTQRSRENAIKNLAPSFGHLLPEQLTSDHIEAYKAQELQRGLQKASINVALRALRQMVKMAYEARHLHTPPIRRWRLFTKADNPRTRILTMEEEARLLLAAPPDLHAKIILALNTGMRSAEVCALQWAWVDVQARLITIPPEHSKNGKEGLVPMNPTVMRLLSGLRVLSDREPTPVGGRVFRYKTLRTTFMRTREKAGLDPAIMFHSLRHTFASRLVAAAVPILHVKDLLRHNDINTTTRYTHLQIDHLRAAVDQLSNRPTPTGMSLTG